MDTEHLTVADAHRAMSDRHLAEPDLVRRLVGNPALAAEWRAPLAERLCNQRVDMRHQRPLHLSRQRPEHRSRRTPQGG